jgi:hypothetical protein
VDPSDDISPEGWAEYLQLLRRAEALPDETGIAAMRAAALARPLAGLSDADIYATEAFLLGHLAEVRQLLGELEALLGEPSGPGLPLGWVSRRARSPARLRGRTAPAGPGTGC